MRLTLESLDAESAEQEPFTIDLGDETVTLPSADDIPASILTGLGDATEAEIAQRVIGSGEWERILNHPSMTLGRLQRLGEAYAEYLTSSGLGELGKSQVSRRSSTGTARR